MIRPKFEWKISEAAPDAAFLKQAKKLKLNELAAKILWERDIREPSALTAFLNPDLSDLHDPFLLYDMKKAVDRMLSAIEMGETILIYGDYDADGITSASIMKSALEELGGEPRVYLPNRFTDGYGPNLEVYRYFIEQEGVSLIITVDNGVSGQEPIAWAKAHGCDVVVTDHHSLPDELPEAVAIVHPRHPKGNYPFDDLCGAGVAFKVACALTESIPTDLLELVAIGTVADMVSLTDENRVLVTEGLKLLAQTEREGLRQLMALAGVELPRLSEEDIGFRIAPRLNSLGRLDDPNPAVTLLTSWDEEETARIAQDIEQKNSERRQLSEKIFDEALTLLDDKPVQVLAREGWHKGVLGIVAGRLLELTGKPVILLSEQKGLLVGSARSIPTLNIYEALSSCRELFVAFGGHAQAAGMTLSADNLEHLREGLTKFVEENDVDLSVKADLSLAGSVSFDELTLDTIKSLSTFAPFGMGNPRPYFLVKNYRVIQSRAIGSDNRHLKLKLAQGKTQIDAIYFGHGKEAFEFEQVAPALAITLSTNTWNGQTAVQLRIEDACAEGVELLDVRSHPMDWSKNATIFEKNELKNGIINDVLVIAEAPTTEEGQKQLTLFLTRVDSIKVIYFKNKIDKSYYLTGGGTREQFAKLYQLIFQQQEIDVRHKLKPLSDYLKIPEILLVKMIQIFEELNFITITDGLLTLKKSALKREISESLIYQELQKTVKNQKFWALAPVKDIYKSLVNL